MNSKETGKELSNYIFHLADSVVDVTMEVAESIGSTDNFDKVAFIASATAQFEKSLTEYIDLI